MSFKFRVFAVVGVFVLALCGCQKGNTNASSGTPENTKSGSPSAKASAKREATKIDARHEEAKAGKETTAQPAVMKSGTLTEADNEMDFNFRQGQLITVVLDSNRASGLSWVLVEPMGSVIVRDGNPVYAARTGKTATGKNAGGIETWHFRASKPGQQLVRMEYRRKWAQTVPERTFRFTGTVK